MKKYRKYYLSPRRNVLMCDVYLGVNKFPAFGFERDLVTFEVIGRCAGNCVDITTYDLELHAFLRVSHQYVVDKDSLDVKIEDMFELENPNLI